MQPPGLILRKRCTLRHGASRRSVKEEVGLFALPVLRPLYSHMSRLAAQKRKLIIFGDPSWECAPTPSFIADLVFGKWILSIPYLSLREA